jgi:hypothetical protein
MSDASLFKWAAHDDLLKPEFLFRCVKAFREGDASIALVYPNAEFIDEDGHTLGMDYDSMQATSDYSFARAFQALQAMNMVASVFGVFRREVLEKTRLIGSFAASDYVLILETAMLGRIVQLDGEPLFRRRIHAGMSRKANRSPAEVLQWFDPDARRGSTYYLEYFGSALQIDDLSLGERVVCIVAIASGFSLRRTRVLLGRWRRRLFSSDWRATA